MAKETNVLEIQTTINDVEVTDSVPVRMHGADFLRKHCGQTGVHIGCEQGVCGMCTVIVNDVAVKSCLMLAVQMDGAKVRTVESLAENGQLNELQAAFREHHGLQCGFCTPGFLMLATHLKGNNKRYTLSELREEASGVLCRCTGYEGPIRAIAQYLGDQIIRDDS